MPNYDLGLFLETTSILDIPNIESQPELRDFLVKLVQSVGAIEKAVNLKDTGIYTRNEFVCGKTFFASNEVPAWATTFPNENQRQIWRKEFLLALPGGLVIGDNPILHGLNINLPADSIWSMTDIYGTTNDITNRVYFPLPYVDPAGNNISLWVDNTTIHINSAIARPTFTLTYVTVEYIKQ